MANHTLTTCCHCSRTINLDGAPGEYPSPGDSFRRRFPDDPMNLPWYDDEDAVAGPLCNACAAELADPPPERHEAEVLAVLPLTPLGYVDTTPGEIEALYCW